VASEGGAARRHRADLRSGPGRTSIEHLIAVASITRSIASASISPASSRRLASRSAASTWRVLDRARRGPPGQVLDGSSMSALNAARNRVASNRMGSLI
jgi:hypothetical protein